MYQPGMGGGPIAPVVATTAVITLPSTGGNFMVTAALSVAAGLVTWGVMYARGLAR